MEYDPKDNDVIHLLKKLKDSNGSYPQEMFSLRREKYLEQVAEVGAGAGLAAGLRNVLKGGKSVGLPQATGTVIEALLVVAIVAEAGAVTYFYRDKLAQYFRSYTNTPKIEQVANPPAFISPSPEIEITLTPSPVVTGTETLTPVTPPSTPSAGILVASTQQPGGSSGSGITTTSGVTTGVGGSSSGNQPVSTEAPKGNNGNHYGQTPLPVRTKEHGNNPNPSSSTQQSNPIPKHKKP